MPSFGWRFQFAACSPYLDTWLKAASTVRSTACFANHPALLPPHIQLQAEEDCIKNEK